MSQGKKREKPQLTIDQEVGLLKQRLLPIAEEGFDLASPEVRDLLRPIAIEFQILIQDLFEVLRDHHANRGWERKLPRLKGAREVISTPEEYVSYLFFEKPSVRHPSEKDGDF